MGKGDKRGIAQRSDGGESVLLLSNLKTREWIIREETGCNTSVKNYIFFVIFVMRKIILNYIKLMREILLKW